MSHENYKSYKSHESHEKHENDEKYKNRGNLERSEKILYREESYNIQGAIFEVYREMGSGFLEAVYQECMEKELSERNIPFVSQPELIINYKGKKLKQYYKPDLICYDKIIIELKGIKTIRDEHRAQVLNYLKTTNLRLGLLVNFGAYPKVEIERIIL